MYLNLITSLRYRTFTYLVTNVKKEGESKPHIVMIGKIILSGIFLLTKNFKNIVIITINSLQKSKE